MRSHLVIAIAVTSWFGCAGNTAGNQEATKQGDMTLGEAPHGAFDAELSAACGDGGATDAGDPVIDRFPYIQNVTPFAASVVWTTADATTADVVMWAPGSEQLTVVEPEVAFTSELPVGKQWIARTTSLEPDSIYCYELRAGDDVLVEATGFRTAPETGADSPVRFITVGDLGEATADQHAVAEQIEDVPHELALITGDVAYDSGSLASFETFFFEVYEPYLDNIPVFPADGNHDVITGQGAPFKEVFALPENGGSAEMERRYSFDWGNIHVAVVDTERLSAEHAAWLDADLAATDQPWKIVIGHRPPYSSGYHGGNGEVRDLFGPVLERHGVQLALWGHDHDYERTQEIAGTTHIVTGGGGVGTRPVGSSSFTAFSEEVTHFVYLQTAGDELRVWAIDATGQTFDTVSIAK